MTVSDDDISVMINEELLERRTKAMFMRNCGATLSTIAKECKVSIATVRKDLEVVRRDINNEQPMDVVARHRAVIFDIQRANYPKMMQGDKDAAATILRALERESKLLGLDSPTRVLAAVSADDFAAEAARLIDSIINNDIDTLQEMTRRDRREPEAIASRVVIDVECEPELADDDGAEAEGAGLAQGDRQHATSVASVWPDLPPPIERPAQAAEAQEDPYPDADQLPDDDDDWSNL